MAIGRHHRVVIELSLSILREALVRASIERVDTFAVRLALRCLLPHCPERWPLISFWSSAKLSSEGLPHMNHTRHAGCLAGLNGIVLQLKAADRYPGEADAADAR